MYQFTETPVTIASGQTVSPTVSLGAETLVGIVTPASFEGTALTFTAATRTTPATFLSVTDPATGAAITVTCGVSNYIPIVGGELTALNSFKITSNVATAADRIITVLSRKMA